MADDDTKILRATLSKNGFAEITKALLKDLNNVVQKETLGHKVATALVQRKQGHFDKAVLTISEANRDQVLAIRKTQSIIDKIEGRSKTEVIFEKFRQFYPFQIGLVNGEDVLKLLVSIKGEYDFIWGDLIADLHKSEALIDPIRDKLNFYETRMKGRISEDDINKLKKKVGKIEERIFDKKTSIIDSISYVVRGEFPQIEDAHKLALVKNIFLILSSSIQTMDAKFVEVDQDI